MTVGLDGEPRNGAVAWLAVVAALIGVLVVGAVIQPFGPPTNDPDAAASVLYFDRLVHGHRLESFVPTTPKPLLTVVYGLTWMLVHDWRALVWETLAIYGLVVGLAVLVGRRVAGWAAGGFLAAVLIGWPEIVLEVSRANSLVWALAGWLVAGWALTSPQRRPVLAGVALLLAGLARFETWLIVGVGAAMVVAGIAVGARPFRRVEVPRRTRIREILGDPVDAPATKPILDPSRDLVLAIGLGGLAVPVALLHDWLLTGNPLFSFSVPARFTEVYTPGLAAITPLGYAGTVVAKYSGSWPLLVLAVLGAVVLVRRRRWLIFGGVATLGLGTLALLFWLAMRAVYISARYYEPIDLALFFLAAVGVAALAELAWRRDWWRGTREEAPRLGLGGEGWLLASLSVGAGVVVGLLVSAPIAPFDRSVAAELGDIRASDDNLARHMPELRASLAGSPPPVDARATDAPYPDLSRIRLLVPSREVSRLVVELDTSLASVGDLYAALVSTESIGTGAGGGSVTSSAFGHGLADLPTGTTIYHDGNVDGRTLFRPLEIARPGAVAATLVKPIDVDAAHRVWILEVTAQRR